MNIQYASDIHLEFRDNARYLRDYPMIPAGDALVLAGDIGYLNDANYSAHPFWDWAADNFRQTLVVPGNHEFYKSGDIGTIQSGCIAEIRSNVKCYYNAATTIDDIQFILCTLWSKIPEENTYITEKSVSDFMRIACNGRLLNAYDFNRAHQKAVEFLSAACQAKTHRKRIIVSHHVPTALCMADEFKNSRINGAFVAEMHDFIYEHDIDYWIYGHSHRNMPEIDINGTQLLCNQLGYVHQKEHLSFRRQAVIEA